MNSQLNRTFGLALLAGALTFGASQVNAQTYKGTFNLPVEAYWGNTVLSPGEYTVVVERGAPIPIVNVREGTRHVTSLIAGPWVTDNDSSRGRLTLVQINGAYVVKAFDAGLLGKTFSFATPKAVRNRQLESRETSRITVDAAGTH